MAKVVIYSTKTCPYCIMAKRLLAAKGQEYENIDLTFKGQERRELESRTGMDTVPQIFIDGQLIGGYDELSALDREGKLDALLASE